jgi:hypothetical protein
MIAFREALPKCGAIDVAEENFLLRLIQGTYGDVHFGRNTVLEKK